MPEETKIDIGDTEEESVDVNLSDDSEKGDTEVTEVSAEGASEDELDEYSSGVKGRINNLTKRFREEERQKQSAVEYAENVRKENENLKKRIDSLDKGYQEQFESRVTNQITSAKDVLRQAHEVGDVDKIVEAVEAQEALANLSVEKGTLRSIKAEKPEEAEVVQTAPAAAVPPAQPDPKAEAWAKSNNWFGQDEVMTYGAFGIHRRLVEEEGFDPQSDDYYAELDSRLKIEFPHKFDAKSKSTGGSRKVASAEASASRNRSGRKTVRLTPSQVAIAKRLNVPLEEYAKYVRD